MSLSMRDRFVHEGESRVNEVSPTRIKMRDYDLLHGTVVGNPVRAELLILGPCQS
ncbi:hypothetical protein OURE66S_00073 [Oligella ureolytica]